MRDDLYKFFMNPGSFINSNEDARLAEDPLRRMMGYHVKTALGPALGIQAMKDGEGAMRYTLSSSPRDLSDLQSAYRESRIPFVAMGRAARAGVDISAQRAGLGAFAQRTNDLVDTFLKSQGAIGGSARIFALSDQTMKHRTKGAMRQFRAAEKLHMQRLDKMGIRLPGLSSSMGMTPHADALQALMTSIAPKRVGGQVVGAGFTTRLEATAENALRLHLQFHDRPGGVRHMGNLFVDLNMQLGERIPILPEMGKVGMPGGMAAAGFKPGTEWSRQKLGRTPHFIPSAIGLIEDGNLTVKTNTMAYLDQLQDILTRFSSGSNALVGKPLERQIRLLEQQRMGTFVYGTNVSQNLAKAQNVLPVASTGGIINLADGAWERPVASAMKGGSLYNYKLGSPANFNAAAEGIVTGAETARAMSRFGLYTTALKPEATREKGLLSTLKGTDLIAFGQYEDPARQIYQVINRGSLAGGKYFGQFVRHLAKSQGGQHMAARATVPWFSTQFLRSAEEFGMNSGGSATQLMATLGIITDPRAIMGIPSEGKDFNQWVRSNRDLMARRAEKMIDPAQGDAWVHQRVAKALTRNVTNQFDMTNPSHIQIIAGMERYGDDFLFTAEGQELMRKGGVGTTLMAGRNKMTIGSTYGTLTDQRGRSVAIESYARRTGSKVVDIIAAGTNLDKYPGMARQAVLGTIMDNVMSKFQQDISDLAPSQLNKVTGTYLGALQSMAGAINADIVMMPETAISEMGGEWGKAAQRMQRRAEDFELIGRKVRGTRDFITNLAEGYLPTFTQAGGKELKLGVNEAGKIAQVLGDRLGIDASVAQTSIAMPRMATQTEIAAGTHMMDAEGRAMVYDKYKGFALRMPTSLRAFDYDMFAKASAVPQWARGRSLPDRFLPKSSQGFKVQQASLRRLGTWGSAGRQVAATIQESIYGHGSGFMNRAYLFGKLAAGGELGQEAIQGLGNNKDDILKVMTEKALRSDVYKNSRLVPLQEMDQRTGTYFAEQAAERLRGGYVLELDNAVNYELLSSGQKVSRKQFFMFGPEFYQKQFDTDSALTEMARAEERFLNAVINERSEEEMIHAARKYEAATIDAMGSKAGLMNKEYFQPRLAGGGWSLISRRTPGTGDFGTAYMSEQYARELGIYERLSTHKQAQYALLERSPVQGPGNVASVRIALDKNMKGRHLAIDPITARRALGDYDQDAVGFLLGTTHKLNKSLAALNQAQFGGRIPGAASLSQAAEEAAESIRREYLNSRGDLSLRNMVNFLDRRGIDDEIKYGFQQQHKFLTALEHAGDNQRFRSAYLRIHTTKATTGQIHTGMELLRHYMDNEKQIASRFAQMTGESLAGKDLSRHAGNLMQVAEEIATIKKAAEPNMRLLNLLESVADPSQALEYAQPKAFESYRRQFQDAVMTIQKEIVTGGKGIPLPGMFEEFGRLQKGAAMSPRMQRHIDDLAAYTFGAMEIMRGDIKSSGVKFGSYISPMAKFIGSPNAGAKDFFEAMDSIDHARNQAIQNAEIIHDARIGPTAQVASEIAIKPDAFSAAALAAETPASRAAADAKVATASIHQMDDVFTHIADWWKNRAGPWSKAGIIGGAGVLGLAAMKNILFPDYQSEFPRSMDYPMHNPPFLGYNVGPGYHDSIPIMPQGEPMQLAPSAPIADYRVRNLGYHAPQIGNSMNHQMPMPAVVSPPPAAPMMPGAVSTAPPRPEVGPMADNRPTARVRQPAHMRTLGEPGMYAERPMSTSVSMGGAKFNPATAQRLASMTNSRVEVMISDDTLSSNIQHTRGRLRDQARGRIHYNAVDPIEAVGAEYA